MDDRIEDFDDDEFEGDEDIVALGQETVAVKPLSAARKPRLWNSVEEYMEERRLKIALSEDNYEYDI